MNNPWFKINFVICVSLFFYCSTTITIPPDENIKISRPATIVTQESVSVDTKNLVSHSDWIIGQDAYSHKRFKIRKMDIDKIVVVDRGKGALNGLIGGTSAGVVLGFINGQNSDKGDPLGHPVFYSILEGFIFGVAGTATGFVTGHKTNYLFEYKSEEIGEPKTTFNDIEEFRPFSNKLAHNRYDSHSNRIRRRWYLLAELAYGSGDMTLKNMEAPFDSNMGRNAGTGANYELGFALGKCWLVGGCAGGLGYTQLKNDIEAEVAIQRFLLTTNYFPKQRGIFVRVGAGFSLYKYSFSNMDDIYLEDELMGATAQFGIGSSFWLGKNFNATIAATVMAHSYEKDHAPSWFQISAGLLWY